MSEKPKEELIKNQKEVKQNKVSKPFIIFNATLIALSIIAFFSLYYQLQAKNTHFKHYISPEELKIYLAYCYVVFVLASLSLATHLFFPKKTKDDSNLAIPMLTTDTKEAEVSGKRNKGFVSLLTNNFKCNLGQYGTLTISQFIFFVLLTLFFTVIGIASCLDCLNSPRFQSKRFIMMILSFFLIFLFVRDILIYFLTKKNKYIIFAVPKFFKVNSPQDKVKKKGFYLKDLKLIFYSIITFLAMSLIFVHDLKIIIKHFAK